MAACLVVYGLVACGALPFPGDVGAYKVTDFSDGQTRKEMLFTAETASGTVTISIPRATNLSAAQLELSASAFTVSEAARYSDFSQGAAVNLSRQGDLRLDTVDRWFNASWSYRLPLTVDAASRTRLSIPVEIALNLSIVLESLGRPGAALDEKSLRVVEVDDQGTMLVFNGSLAGSESYAVPMAWNKAAGYGSAGNANGKLTWLVNGTTAQNKARRYNLYFDETANGEKPAGKAVLSFWNDVIFSNWDPYENTGFYYDNHNGTFGNTSNVNFTTHASAAVTSGDFDADGYLDIAFANWYNGSSFDIDSVIYSGSAEGIDENADWFLPTCGTFGIGVGDVNSDGYDDVIFPGIRSGSNFQIGTRLYYGGPQGPVNSTYVFLNSDGATDAAIADFNKDGSRDVAIANAFNGTSGNIDCYIYLNNGGTVGPTPDILLPCQSAFAIEVADLNKDSWQDIVIANQRNTSMSGSAQFNINSYVYYGKADGYNSTPDVLLPTYGALDAKISDLNGDGWLDVIFANYNDGASYNTMSQAYFGGPTGIPTSPGAYFQTSWAYGLDVGDVNNDGIVDVAFANYYNGVTTAINSTIFIGPCVSLQLPDIFLPTRGADDVHIADVDHYYMSKDRNPPVVTTGVPDGRYVPSGAYTSTVIPVDEKVLSASATWTAILPSAPAGSAVNVSLSNDAGTTWNQVQQGVPFNFTSFGKTLRYKVDLFSDRPGVGTPVFQDINIVHTKESYPYNVTLDVNADGRAEWSFPGRFNGTAILNESTMGLATWLQQVVPRVGSGNFTVPLKFSSERPGVLLVSGINITGNYRPEALQLIPDIIMTENIPLPNAFNVNNYFRHLDEDKLEYITIGDRNVFLNISDNGSVTITTTPSWYGEEHFILRAVDDAGEWADIPMDVEVRHVLQPPRFIVAMPDITVDEGDTVFSAFNLLEYVFDQDNPKTSLIFSVADVSNPNVSVSMDINDNIEVRSKAGWDGTAVVKIKVSDGELSAIASFNVTVVRHNRPPIIGQLPPVQLEQDGSLDRSFNLLNFTTDSDTPKQNLTFKIDDNTNPSSGVSITADGWVGIRPVKGWSGTALVVVNVSDSEFGVRASFTVTVTPKAVTPTPTPTTDNSLNYIVIVFFIVVIAMFVVDVGMRMRKPGHPPQQAQSRPPEAATARPVAVAKRSRPRAEAPGAVAPLDEAPPVPAAPAPSDVQAVPRAAEAPAAAPLTEAPPGTPAAAREAPASAGYEFAPVEQATQPSGGDMAPVPSTPQAPPETAPDMTPPSGAPGPVGWHAEPETMEMDAQSPEKPDPHAGPTGFFAPGPAAPEISPGEVEQGQAASAASLLASLQKPVPKLESEAAAQPPPAEASAPLPSPPESAGIGERIEAAMISKATESERAPADTEQKDVRPITRVRCAGCKAAIPIFSAQRPLVVTCPQCGRMGMLK